jgi:hypothetical protein
MSAARRDDARFEERDGAGRGVTRRTAVVAAAWTTPVVSAAVAAPGAAASAPVPVDEGPYVGLFLIPRRSGEFRVDLRVARSGAAGAPVLLADEARVDITSEHDFESWSSEIVVDGPSAGHLLIPAGAYPSAGTYTGKDGVTLQIARIVGSGYTRFTPEPRGRFSVTATVTRGRVHPGSDPKAQTALGFGTQTIGLVN